MNNINTNQLKLPLNMNEDEFTTELKDALDRSRISYASQLIAFYEQKDPSYMEYARLYV